MELTSDQFSQLLAYDNDSPEGISEAFENGKEIITLDPEGEAWVKKALIASKDSYLGKLKEMSEELEQFGERIEYNFNNFEIAKDLANELGLDTLQDVEDVYDIKDLLQYAEYH